MHIGNKKYIVAIGKQVSLNGDGTYKVTKLSGNDFTIESDNGIAIDGSLIDNRLRVIDV